MNELKVGGTPGLTLSSDRRVASRPPVEPFKDFDSNMWNAAQTRGGRGSR